MLSDAETIALVEELVGRANLAMVNTLNAAARRIYGDSQLQVPKSEAHHMRPDRPGYPAESLKERGRLVEATPESHVAQVLYEGPSAAAQEVGAMTYQSRKGKTVEWRVGHYTTPGTKSRYLEDPAKAVLSMIPEELAVQGRIAFGELPGMTVSKSTLSAQGHREELAVKPTGEIGQTMQREDIRAQNIAPEALQKAPSAPPILQ